MSDRTRKIALILLFSLLGFAAMGYHPGAEDDAVYLTGIQADLNPALYPHDGAFFRVQLQATVFDKWMADFVRATHISLAWSELLWQSVGIVAILWACQSIAAQLFTEERAQWAAVAMVSAMFTLPVAGTALYLVDQHLHPRALASALVLVAVSSILDARRWRALPLLLLAAVLHPIVGALGISFCVFLALSLRRAVPGGLGALGNVAAAFVPLGWVFEPPTPDWRKALDSRTYYFLSRWEWYEWLGAIAPLFLFWLLWRVAARRGETKLARFSLATMAYGFFQLAVAFVVLGIPALVRLTPMQPMRFLHLIYVFLCLVGGGLAGKYLLRASAWRWAIFLVAIYGGMFLGQRELFASSDHLEMPWTRPENAWEQAFAWIRANTPEDAYFALDPRYVAAPGEDYHSFRALAERSMMSDAIKDTSVVTQVPELAPVWREQQEALAGWSHFQLGDFERLKARFGVNWVVIAYPPPPGLKCRWHGGDVSVCPIP
jgi:uncharacterized membrane protein